MELATYQSYTQFKQELDSEIRREAEGFVKIGYLLRVAQDTDILRQSDYENVNDFAKVEYGLDKSQVSRFIAINERFSQNGYAAELDMKYQGFGVAKLGIMLQLPDAVNEQLSPDMTKAEINSIKEEVKEEQKISDIEVMLEPKSTDPLLQQIFESILHEHPDIYEEIWEENKKATSFNIKCSSRDYADDILAAAGEAVYTTRVSGVGKVMLTIRAGKEKLIITNMRTGEVTEPEWEDLGRILWFQPVWRNAELEWVDKYQEEWPLKVQPEEKKEEKKPAKVVTSPKPAPKTPEKPINPQCESIPEEKPQEQQAEEVKTAENVDFPQYDEFMNKPIEEVDIEPVEEEIEEIAEEIPEIAPVQQSENVDLLQSPAISSEEEAMGEFVAKGLENGINNAPIVETKTLIQLKDDVVKLLGEVIGLIYESKWFEAQTNLEHVDFMIKGCISEELKLNQEEEDEEDE